MTTKKASSAARRRRPVAANLTGDQIISAATPDGRSSVDIARKLDILRSAWREGVLSIEERDERMAPLIGELHRAGKAEAKAMRAAIGPLGVTIGTTVVVAGELIESAWGNQVRTDLLALNTGKLELSGGTMTGTLLLPASQSASSFAAVHKTYVDDTFVALAGDTMTGALLLPVSQSASATAAVHKTYVDDTFVALGGDTMTGTLNGTNIAMTGNITADANMQADGTVQSGSPNIASGTNGTQIGYQADGAVFCVTNSGASATHSLVLNRQGAGAAAVGQNYARFGRTNSDTNIGSISIASASAVAFNTTSDARTKTRSAKQTDVAELIQKLGRKAYRGRYTADGSRGREWTFLDAQDIQKVMPELVTAAGKDPQKDPMQVNFPGMVPAIAGALAVVLDRLDALEVKLAKAGK